MRKHNFDVISSSVERSKKTSLRIGIDPIASRKKSAWMNRMFICSCLLANLLTLKRLDQAFKIHTYIHTSHFSFTHRHFATSYYHYECCWSIMQACKYGGYKCWCLIASYLSSNGSWAPDVFVVAFTRVCIFSFHK